MRKMWQTGDETLFDDISDAEGDEIQKLSVFQTLPSLLAEDPEACIQRLIIPIMHQTLTTASPEFHVAASTSFKTILEQRLVTDTVFTQTFLQRILRLLNHKDQVVAHTWLETLPDVIDLLPPDIVARKILPVAINKGHLSQPVESRIICCKLLGRICTRLDSQTVKKDVMPTVHSLCQDESSEVRACICSQLHFVAEGLGPESVKSSLLSLIIELANDEEAIVRQASVQTIVHLLPHLQANVLGSVISPLFKKLCENSLKNFDSVIFVIAEEYGKIVIGLEKCLSASERTWFLGYFQQLAQLGTLKQITSAKNNGSAEPEIQIDLVVRSLKQFGECRRLCAFNIPAMFLFASSSSPEDVDMLLSTFSDLAIDQHLPVRRVIACGFHEIAKILGPKCHLIKKDFIQLLNKYNKISQFLIPNIAQTLELIIQSNKITGAEDEDSLITELGSALLACEKEISSTYDWRSSATMLEQLEILPKLFPSDYLYAQFVPVAFERALTTRPIPVRVAAGRLLLVFTRYNLKPTQRNSIRNRLQIDFAENQSCYVRVVFVDMMREAMAIFSSNYFKEHFFATVLSLWDDPIANVRYKLVSLFPMLKSYIRLPSDKKLLSSYESNVRNLINNEKDHDVLGRLAGIIRKIDNIEIRHEGQTSSAKLSQEDSEDLRKFEEEKELESIKEEKSPVGQLPMTIEKKLLTSGRANTNDGASSHASKQSTVVEGPSKPSASTSQKVKQTSVTEPVTESSFKATRQTTGFPRNGEPSKSSTSSDNLTSSWVRLTSNRVLLSQLWKKIDQPESTNSSYNPTNTSIDDSDDFISDMSCGCSNTSSFIISDPKLEPNKLNLTSSCSCDNLECKETFHSFLKHNYFDSHSRVSPLHLTHTKESRHENTHNYYSPFLSRESVYDDTNSPNFAALRAVTNAAQYNSCWAFSSMPEVPVILLDDEFLVDTGVRIPAQLSSSQSTSKIPNLQDIIYRNARIGNKYDKGNKILHTPLTERLTSVDQKGNRLSGNFDSRFTYEVRLRDNLKYKKQSGMQYKFPSNSETSQSKGLVDKYKRSSFTMEREVNRYKNYPFDTDSGLQLRVNSKDKRCSMMQIKTRSNSESSQSKTLDDKAKRSSYASDRDINDKFKSCLKTGVTSYNNEGPIFSRYSKQNFKRHSVEVTDYAPVNIMNRLKRNFTLDVNHNQGISKIPLRKSIASGSRTAPVTRASSPIRWETQLSFDADHQTTKYSEPTVSSNHFSDDDPTDRLACEKFTNPKLSNIPEGGFTKKWVDKLPSDMKNVSSEDLNKMCSKFADVAPKHPATKGPPNEEDYLSDWISKLPVWNPNARKNM